MKTVSILSAAVLSTGLIAGPGLASAAPLHVTGAPYNDKVDPQNLAPIENQPTPRDVMIPGSSASQRLYAAQVRETVEASPGKGFHRAEREDATSSAYVPGSEATF
ncbi:hypothetical protein [Jiella pacifica]|uniref:DUF4148 domain-containing protein n=1 Tax=Jiella pacifica TaxID=2696469 RepID=A0A6N9T076_9HYPH|nr:hypothetical protein [Jiella pacifica]NDW03982.1 hypothetical protein [Jiella pacifica]